MKPLKEQIGEYPTMMQNPGDLRPNDHANGHRSERVLILHLFQAVLVKRSEFDTVVPLPGNDASEAEERAVLKETTYDTSG